MPWPQGTAAGAGRTSAAPSVPGVQLLSPLARPLRALARVRPPAILDPDALRPGDPPPTDGRALVLYDEACGVCLHGRDLIARLDRRGRLAHDVIGRHTGGLLAAVPPEAQYESWHVIHPDGRIEHGGAGVIAVIDALPGGHLPAAVLRRVPGLVDRGYRAFATHRVPISQGLGLSGHPQRSRNAP